MPAAKCRLLGKGLALLKHYGSFVQTQSIMHLCRNMLGI